MPALTSLSSKINNTIHPRCNLSFSNYCLDKWVHLIQKDERGGPKRFGASGEGESKVIRGKT
jgi:hypothetical protein